jgi:DNA (cytosine-5)-methyltransferase 1
MKHGSLFSGIGGFDLAAEWMGWDNVFHCEWNEFGKRVLHHYWPEAISYHDITSTDFTVHRGTIDILTGGFPCQPYSAAGKRKGKDDARHLWPHMLRAIREIRPRYVVGENVGGLLTWNAGLVFDEVQSELEAEGYEVIAFVLPAAAVEAPHRRDRVWIVAHAQNDGRHGGKYKLRKNIDEDRAGLLQHRQERGEMGAESERHSEEWSTPHADSDGRNSSHGEHAKYASERGQHVFYDVGAVATPHAQSTGSTRQRFRRQGQGQPDGCDSGDLRAGFRNFPTQPPICGGDDGLPRELDGVTFSKWRNQSVMGYGNAIVPQVAYQIFQAIQSTHTP